MNEIILEYDDYSSPEQFRRDVTERLPVFEEVPIYDSNGNLLKNHKGIVCRKLDDNNIIPVSKGYKLIQHKEIVEPLFKNLVEMKYPIEKMRLTTTYNQSSMFIDILSSLTEKVNDQEIIKSGIRITNSTIGKMKVMGLPYVLRVLCSNGMVHQSMVFQNKFRHYGNYDLKSRFKDMISAVVEFFPSIIKNYDTWVNTDIIINPYVLNELEKIIPKKYIPFTDGDSINCWDFFNHMTKLNTHDEKRGFQTKHIFHNKIERAMKILGGKFVIPNSPDRPYNNIRSESHRPIDTFFTK